MKVGIFLVLWADAITKIWNEFLFSKRDFLFSQNDVKGSLDFKNVEFPDPLVQGKPLLSQLNAKMSEGQTLALVPLDNETLNPLELLVERFFEPTRGALVSNALSVVNVQQSVTRDFNPRL